MLLTGWKLGDGPCGASCSEEDIGNETTSERVSILKAKHQDAYYGQFFLDYDDDIGKHPETPVGRRDMVQLVNEHSKWELESSILTFEMEHDGDIM